MLQCTPKTWTFQDVGEDRQRGVTLERSGQQFRYPVLNSRKIEMIVLPAWGEWLKVGELTATAEYKAQAIFVPLDKPERKNQPQDNHPSSVLEPSSP